MEDAEFLTEFGVGWTAVGMVGAEDLGNVITRILFVLIVTSNRAAWPRVNARGYCRGGGMLPAERQ